MTVVFCSAAWAAYQIFLQIFQLYSRGGETGVGKGMGETGVE